VRVGFDQVKRREGRLRPCYGSCMVSVVIRHKFHVRITSKILYVLESRDSSVPYSI